MSAPASTTSPPVDLGPPPVGNASALGKYFQFDFISGFLVFLIALPLCLGIAGASNYPPIAGVFTAIVGALLTTLFSNSELTIKGPAAGLIVITAGCVQSFGFSTDATPEVNHAAYQAALAVGVVAGLIQIAFAVFRLGILQEFFPSSVVHGMLAAIGVIIISKQAHTLFGVKPEAKEPLHLLAEVPHTILHMNPEVALIGISSLILMFGWSFLKNKTLKKIPSQLLVVILAVGLGAYFKLEVNHDYLFGGKAYKLDPAKTLVNLPDNLLKAITFPDFSALAKPVAWFWVLMFTLIGSLESLLSAKAVDLIDPWKRKTDFDKDLLAVGIANTAVAFIGGLPMISEIVRSKANIDNGARTRFADMWHGVFLLAAVLLIPHWLHRIPLAALAAMLVFTGFRLASPKEFLHVYHIGKEQLIIFVATIIGVLATDLLIGVFIGIGVKLFVHILNGVSPLQLFRPYIDVEPIGEDGMLVRTAGSAVFSNWIPFRNQIETIGLVQRKNVTLDFTNTRLIDSSVMEKLAGLQTEFEVEGLKLELVGLGTHEAFSSHEHATRKRAKLARMRRVTIIAPAALEQELEQELAQRGASGFTAIPCRGVGRKEISSPNLEAREMVKIEVIAPENISRQMLIYLQQEVRPNSSITSCLEMVEVVQADDFAPQTAESAKSS